MTGTPLGYSEVAIPWRFRRSQGRNAERKLHNRQRLRVVDRSCNPDLSVRPPQYDANFLVGEAARNELESKRTEFAGAGNDILQLLITPPGCVEGQKDTVVHAGCLILFVAPGRAALASSAEPI